MGLAVQKRDWRWAWGAGGTKYQRCGDCLRPGAGHWKVWQLVLVSMVSRSGPLPGPAGAPSGLPSAQLGSWLQGPSETFALLPNTCFKDWTWFSQNSQQLQN